MWFSNSRWVRQVSQVQSTKGSQGTTFLTLEVKTDLHGGVFVHDEIAIHFLCIREMTDKNKSTGVNI